MTEFNLATELERLAKLGYAPIVIYDDNGNWAISDEGCGFVRTNNDEDFSFTSFGRSEWFKPTVKEAWECYITRLTELGNEI